MLPLTPKWLDHFMGMAQHCAQMSKDPSTQVGSVIVAPDRTVVSTGYNGFPRGCRDDELLYLEREIKYRRVVHAEMNAILTAGKPLHNCTLFVWPLPVCDRCIPHVIQTGISRIVQPPIDPSERWAESCTYAMGMALEAGLTVVIRGNK